MNRLDPDHCYQALRTHDRRFDGRFFVAVSSTGIYCRPVCPARTPKQANCQFFRHAAAAEQAGFRPCLRCRPELAPGLSTLEMPDQLLLHACRWINAGFLNKHNLQQLAERLGISDRHLRRLFQQHYGVSPLQYVQSQRLLQAKQLLTDTYLPMSDVAAMSGFGSTRRFNSLFQQHYRLTPSQLRTESSMEQPGKKPLQLYLSYRPPCDWQTLLNFLAQRSIAGVEVINDSGYRRTLHWTGPDGPLYGWLHAEPEPDRHRVKLTLSDNLSPVLPDIQRQVRQLFDMDCDPEPIQQQLGPLAAAHPGLRLPSCFDGFEMSVRAILGQQVTVKAAHTLAGRIAQAFGHPIETPWPELTTCFPQAKRIAQLKPEQLAELGIIRQRASAIIALAQALVDGSINLTSLAPVDETLKDLQALPGIGPWTAQYIGMRALAWPDAFPDSDLGVMKAVGSRKRKEILTHAEAWRPWRAYAVMHLWHQPARTDSENRDTML